MHALNNQFYSVFTGEDLAKMPESADTKVISNVPLETLIFCNRH